MGRRHNLRVGNYSNANHPSTCNGTGMPSLSRMASTFLWATYSSINRSYMAVLTVCLVVFISFFLPDISQKIQRTKELNDMKKALGVIVNQVSKAEVACLTVAEQIIGFQCSMHDGTTETFNNQEDLAVCTSNSTIRTTQSAPVQIEKRVGMFQRMFFPNRNASNKEIAIMSYVYTDSFDVLGNKIENEAKILE